MSELRDSDDRSVATAGAAVKAYLTQLHDRITTAVEAVDGGTFRRDAWQRPEGGGGESRVLSDGGVFERAGVGFSHVFGEKMPQSASSARPGIGGAPLRGDGTVARVPSAQSVRADDACERALLDRLPADRPRGLVVRRRLRPHALLPVRRGRAALASNRARRVPAVRRRHLREIQGLVRPLFLPAASERDARRRRIVLRRPPGWWLRALIRLDAERRRPFPARLHADTGTAQGGIRMATASGSSNSTAAAAMSNST